MGELVLGRDFRKAAIMTFRDQSYSRLKWGQWWLKHDPNLKDETKGFLAGEEPTLEYKFREVMKVADKHEWQSQGAKEGFVRRALITMILQERARLCHRWLLDCDKMLPPFALPPSCIRPLPDPKERVEQAAPWWNGGPVKGKGDEYINNAMNLIDGTYNAMILRLESLRATAPPPKVFYPAVRMGM